MQRMGIKHDKSFQKITEIHYGFIVFEKFVHKNERVGFLRQWCASRSLLPLWSSIAAHHLARPTIPVLGMNLLLANTTNHNVSR